jgi:hypothetical protein
MTAMDLRDQGIDVLDTAEIPTDIVDLGLANNQLTTLPNTFFRHRPKLWKLDLSSNLLVDLSFLRCYGSFGHLDLRNNCLAFDELLDIAHIYIAHLRIEGNDFSKHTNNCPLTLPVILEHVWIIDGQFISDFIRKQARAFRETLAFGQTVLACRRIPTTTSQQIGATQAASSFLAGDSVKFHKNGEIMTSSGVSIHSNDRLPQIHRLRHLATLFPPRLAVGTFADYFGLAMGILSLEWLDTPIEVIPRAVCHDYWVWNCEGVEGLEPYERLLLLLRICESARPHDDVEAALWKALGVINFIETGDIPMRGATPRLLLCAFLERIPDHDHPLDRLFYLKLREHGAFTGQSLSFDEIYAEIAAPIPIVAPVWPSKDELIEVRHPVTDDWVTARCVKYRDGRVICRAGGELIQLPLVALFWDARGTLVEECTWREARKKAMPLRPRSRGSQELPPEVDIQRPPTRNFPTIREPPRSDTRMLLQSGIQLMSTSKFIDRTTRQVDTFTGISMPRMPPRPAVSRSAPSRRPMQFIQDVVNVTIAPDTGSGHRMRKFNARVENVLTHRSQYLWIHEDEVAEEDAAKLAEMYRRHIEQKFTVISGL